MGDGRTTYNIGFAHVLLVNVGLAQARPNYHYTKIIVVHACVRAYGREFTGSESTPVQKAFVSLQS